MIALSKHIFYFANFLKMISPLFKYLKQCLPVKELKVHPFITEIFPECYLEIFFFIMKCSIFCLFLDSSISNFSHNESVVPAHSSDDQIFTSAPDQSMITLHWGFRIHQLHLCKGVKKTPQ